MSISILSRSPLQFLGSLSDWARRASGWSELGGEAARPASVLPADTGALIYRLRHWPTLPHAMRTADVLRLLSLMSTRPVSRQWMLAHGKLTPRKADALLDCLVMQGAVDEINPASLPREPAGARR